MYAGFNVETVEYKNISFTVWDVGGQDKVKIISSKHNSPNCLPSDFYLILSAFEPWQCFR